MDIEEGKDYLKLKYEECNIILKKLKRKNKRLKIIYFVIIVFIMVSQTSIAIITTITVPPLLVPIISGLTTVLV